MQNRHYTQNRKQFVFKHWSRARYGVFKSIGRQVAIATMVLAFSLVFEVKTTQAQADTADISKTYEMDEVVITGERTPVLYSRLARVVTVLDKEEIESAPVQDITGLLEYVLNLDIRQRGNHGVQADIAMRGGTFDQTLVLLNGVNMTDPQTGHHNLNLPLNLSSVDRIEVLQGPASRVFGVNAFNGAINIITNPSKEQKAKVSLSGGEFGFLKGDASTHFQTGKFRHFVSASHKKSNGYLQDHELNNTDFKNTNIFYHGKINAPDGQFDVQGGWETKGFGANSFYTPAYPNQYEATETGFGSVRYTFHKEGFTMRPVVYYRRHQDRFELFRDDAPDWYGGHNHHLTDVWGANVSGSANTGFGHLAFGLDYRNEHIFSNVLGKEMDDPVDVPGESAVFTQEDNRSTLSLNAEYSFDWKGLHLAAGVMATHYSEVEEVQVYPGLEASYRVFGGFRIFGSYNEAMRLPTFTDLYYSGPTNIGNPDLKPEESATVEGGLKYTGPAQRIQMAVFHRNGENIIDWVKENEEEKWQPQNLVELNATGLEISWEFRPQAVIETLPVSKFQIAYSYTDLEKAAGDLISQYVLDNLKHKLSINLRHQVFSNMHANWGVTYQDRAGAFVKYSDGSYGEETPYKPFWLLDTRLTWQESDWKIYAEASNLLDKTYYDHGNVPQPGRWIRFGAEYALNW
ncbi:MAG: TonB-dependent receptor [Bacteroidales bacterium]|nr:TonB-dependent receptor [Bacteroidales bacterium]MCF8338783.1 TonB-dependent receptor [Bacteroidales bacterium]